MGLFDALRVGLSGLTAAQAGLETAQNNVVNVNTPGYARLRPNLEEVVLSTNPTLNIPGGVRVTGSVGVRSSVLEARVASAESGVAGAEAALRQLGALESAVAPGGVSELGASVAALSPAFTRLAARPEDTALRQEVFAAADNVAGRLTRLGDDVSRQALEAQRELGLRAGRANELARGLAEVNVKLAQAWGDTASRSALLGRQTALMQELAKEVDIRSYTDEEGRLQVTLANGMALVAGGTAFALDVDSAPGGAVRLAGQDVTDAIGGGAVGGVLAARDAAILPTLGRLDAIAQGLAQAFNDQHALGFDAAGNPGGDVFAVGTGTQPGSVARGFQLVLAGPEAVAAAATPAPGDGDNALALADVAGRAGTVSVGGLALSVQEAIGQLTWQVGSSARSAADDEATQSALREQARSARDQLSAVSLDEEAADMIRYQRAYEASARFLQTVNELLVELMSTVGR
jgi:flagellar hook-associated protein 1 FlgK